MNREYDDFYDQNFYADDKPEIVSKKTRAQIRAEKAREKKLKAAARKKRRANVEKVLGRLRRELLKNDWDIHRVAYESGVIDVTPIGGSFRVSVPNGQTRITLNCSRPLEQTLRRVTG